MSKFFTEEDKKKYVAAFCNEHNFSYNNFTATFPGVSKSSLYKWAKIYEPDLWYSHVQSRHENHNFVDISTSILNDDNIASSNLVINVSGVSISLDSSFNEDLLLKVVRSLKKL